MNKQSLFLRNKLLVICGPTGTGKSQLAFHLGKLCGGEIISADSRQVYKYMDIGTGKDKTEVGNIFGYDLVKPNQKFSVRQYLDFVMTKLGEIYKKGRLPILVGGTGLYLKAVVDGIDTIDVPKNEKLRERLSKKRADELFGKLMEVDPIKGSLMNESDRKNPRRLIRAIEVSLGARSPGPRKTLNFDALFIGLMAPKEALLERIGKRVDERVKEGIEREVAFLKKNHFWEGAPQVTLGYREWPDIEAWKREEFKYAKRQLTWFKKEKRINWFDITKKSWQEEVERLVKKWYFKGNAKKN